MLPAWMADGAADGGPAHIVCVDREGLRLIAASATTDRSDVDADRSVEDHPHLTGSAIAAQLAALAKTKGPISVGLRIPFAYCFHRLAELPSAAEKDFARLLALDLERATPFRASDVFSSFMLSPQAGVRPGKAAVRHFIVKRSLLVGAVAEVERAGLRIGRIDCWDETGRTPLKIDLRGLDVSDRARERSLLRPIVAAGIAAILLAGFGAHANLEGLKASLARLEEQSQALRARAASERTSKEAAGAAQSTLVALETLAASPPAKLDIIDDLTQLIPDSAWISDLRVTDSGVDINGFAQSTVALLPLLEKSPRFMDATSAAAVTFDPRENKERFSLHVRYRTSALALAQLGGDRR